MPLKGIIFDKDGTLIDFDACWISVCREAMSRVLKSAGADLSLVDKILFRLGVKDGAADIDGILCSGTYEQMGEVAYEIISSSGCPADREKIIEMTKDEHKNCASLGLVRPTCEGLAEALLKLKSAGLRLAVVTTDTKEITEMCLGTLEIKELFGEIYCDDGLRRPYNSHTRRLRSCGRALHPEGSGASAYNCRGGFMLYPVLSVLLPGDIPSRRLKGYGA